MLALTAGLIWQAMLVCTLVGVEQQSLSWVQLREALWLHAPRDPKTGRPRGRLWWIVVPFMALSAVGELIPALPHSDGRDFGLVLESDAGEVFFNGNWGWFALVVVMFVFDTIVGEELLFRGYLLPRMEGAFGDKAWVANGVLFGAYHLHVSWVIPATVLIDTFALSHRSQRYRSAWIGIIVHSAQSVVLTIALVALVVE